MKKLTLLFLPLILFYSNLTSAKNTNDYPCATPDLVFLDTSFTPDVNGYYFFEVNFTLNGAPYWCTYNPHTGQTSSNLALIQYMVGFGDYNNPHLVYNLVDGVCEGARDTLHLVGAINPPHIPSLEDDPDTVAGAMGSDGDFVYPPIIPPSTDDKLTPPGPDDQVQEDAKNEDWEIKLYPNPTIETINLNFLIDDQKDATFQLVDLNGRIQFQEALTVDNQKMDVRELEGGVYIYRIIAQNQIMKSGKLIIR